MPSGEVRTFETDGERLRVPGFGYLGGELLYAAVTEGVKSPEVRAYFDSVLVFVGEEKQLVRLQQHRRSNGRYPTTEVDILENYASDNGHLSEVEGLRLVLAACDELEAQVSHLLREDEPTAADAS